jgi:hypothetical protein
VRVSALAHPRHGVVHKAQRHESALEVERLTEDLREGRFVLGNSDPVFGESFVTRVRGSFVTRDARDTASVELTAVLVAVTQEQPRVRPALGKMAETARRIDAALRPKSFSR